MIYFVSVVIWRLMPAEGRRGLHSRLVTCKLFLPSLAYTHTHARTHTLCSRIGNNMHDTFPSLPYESGQGN